MKTVKRSAKELETLLQAIDIVLKKAPPDYKSWININRSVIARLVKGEQIDNLMWGGDLGWWLQGLRSFRVEDFLSQTIRIPPSRVTGFLFHSEGMYLAHKAGLVPKDQWIVELGTLQGKSASYIARGIEMTGQQFVSVDHFQGSEEHQSGTWEQPKNLEQVCRNWLKQCKVEHIVNLMVNTTTGAAKRWGEQYTEPNVGMLFVDASHKEKDVLRDLQAWLPFVVNDGIVICHDCTDKWDPPNPWVGVRKAVAQIQKEFKFEIVPSPQNGTQASNVQTVGSLWAGKMHR